jgi:putative redox protein
MQMMIDFPGGSRVDAHFGDFSVPTDQPSASSKGSAPSPFDTFLASIGTCAGFYVLNFCQQRGLPTEGIRIMERTHRSQATGLVERIELEIQVPPSFPEKYHSALVNSAELCAVKKHLEHPPKFDTFTTVIESTASD